MSIIDSYYTKITTDIQEYFDKHPIPEYFYFCLFGELLKIFGIAPVIKADINDIDEYLCLQGGTGGWVEAFKESCEQCNMPDLLTYYNSVNWEYSDLIDDYIETHMIDCLSSNADNSANAYYKFLLKKHGDK